MTLLLARILLSVLATTLAAMAAERALRDVARQARFVWAVALLFSALSSVLLVTGGRLPLGVPVVAAWLNPPVAEIAYAPAGLIATESGGDPLRFAWIAASLALGALLALALLRQHRRLRAEPVARVNGFDVVVTRALGPAVYGFLHPRIVVPDWLLDRSEEERRLVVQHEAEHITARDPLLAACALVVVCLIPWNPFLWYQLQRLRLAIELDCDARVLRRGDARAYGRLLVDVADRLARGTPLATALAFPRNFLEWRIRMIVNRRTRPLRAVALALGAGALVVAACADAGDPVAADPQESSVAAPEENVMVDIGPMVLQADSIEFDTENDRVILRDVEAFSAEFERVPDPDTPPRTNEAPAGLVRFRATLDADDRPAQIDIDEMVPSDVQDRAREALRTQQFRRSVANPNAPVEGVIAVD